MWISEQPADDQSRFISINISELWGRKVAWPTPAYAPASPIGGWAAPLESQIGSFWEIGDALDDLDTTPRKPEVSHALLRRLGPSPFGKGGFPLVGLLATCYDVVGDEARREEMNDADAAPP